MMIHVFLLFLPPASCYKNYVTRIHTYTFLLLVIAVVIHTYYTIHTYYYIQHTIEITFFSFCFLVFFLKLKFFTFFKKRNFFFVFKFFTSTSSTPKNTYPYKHTHTEETTIFQQQQ